MKRKFKLIVPSFVALIFCFLLIAGSTFALFTSKADASISVSTGKVKIEAQLGDMKRYSAIPDADIEPGADGYAGYATAHEVSSHYAYQLQGSGNGSFLTNGQATLSEENKLLTLDRIAPGDRVTLKLDIENKSDVNIKYRIRVNALELLDADQSYKLFKQLTILLDNDDSIDNDDLDDLNGVNKVGLWKTIGAGEAINDLMIDISLPVDSSDDYQELKTKIQFTVEAVQGNANTNTLLEQINDYLASRSIKNNTMHEALQDVIALGNQNSKTYNLDTIKDYLWNSETDQFYTEDSIEGFIGQYFKVYNTMPDVQTYNIYASNSWNVAEIEGLQVGFDAGDTTNITSIKYDRSNAAKGKEVIIRTNSSNTSLDVNAPLDVVHHYGPLGYLKIQQVANSSYHENGQVAFMEVSKGRVALEKNSEVTQLHISSIKEVNPQTNELETTNEFAEIIVAIEPTVDKPTFSRDDVEIASTGTLVVALQSGTADVTEDTELDYVWLTKQGIFEQIKVSDNSESMADAKWADELDSTKPAEAKTQGAAIDIANNIGRDSNNNIDVKVEVTKNEETKTYKVELNENRDLVVVDKDDTTKAEIATISQSGEVTVDETKYIVALANNTETKATELVVTSQGEEPEVIKATAVEQSGLSEDAKKEQKDAVVEEAVIEEVSSDVNNAARIKTTAYETLKAAIEAAKDGETVVLLQDRIGSDKEDKISINKNITLDLGNNILETEALTVYSLDNLTIKNGTLNGQLRVGEHQYTIVKWKYSDGSVMHGYHPLAPAKNVVLNNVTINSSNKVALYFTNIEDDLTRADESNPFDQDLYGHWIYKTGYQTIYEVIPDRSEIFTACEYKDHLTLINCSVNSNGKLIGNMHDINDNLYTEVLELQGGSYSNDSLGRFVSLNDYLVETQAGRFEVVNQAPLEYVAKVNNIYYTLEGGANLAITYANFGETVYIKENADVVKVFSEDKNGNPDILIIYYEAENIAYTGVTPYNPTYDVVDDTETIPGAHRFYSAYLPIAAVYATGQGGNWKTATKVNDYGTLQGAFSALSDNYTIVILRDFTVGDEQSYKYGGKYYDCAAGFANRATIDFNGHVITYTGTGACIISSQETGYLYIKDTSNNNSGGIIATGNGMCFRKFNSRSDYTYISGGTYIAYNNYAMSLDGGCGITISGGVFQTNHATKGTVYSGGQISYNKKTYKYEGPGLAITGGKFIASANKDCITNFSTSGKVNVSGGTFTKAPNTNIIVSGKSAVDNGDGTWTVK